MHCLVVYFCVKMYPNIIFKCLVARKYGSQTVLPGQFPPGKSKLSQFLLWQILHKQFPGVVWVAVVLGGNCLGWGIVWGKLLGGRSPRGKIIWLGIAWEGELSGCVVIHGVNQMVERWYRSCTINTHGYIITYSDMIGQCTV